MQEQQKNKNIEKKNTAKKKENKKRGKETTKHKTDEKQCASLVAPQAATHGAQ